jgi:glucose-6-phosphate isomerase
MEKITFHLNKELTHKVEKRLSLWQEQNISSRLWNCDPAIWKENPAEQKELADRLGWLNKPYKMLDKIYELQQFADEIKNDFTNVLLLGMGGSSLAPEVFAKTFGTKQGYLKLEIIDSTHPLNLKRITDTYDLSKTLFIVASKSGGTIETMSFYYFFSNEVSKFNKNPGNQFVALTDPNTWLENFATEKKFRKIFSTPNDVGGRYSALTYFGMLPAALMGIDVERFLLNAKEMADECQSYVEASKNPGFYLGAVLGELHESEKDKVTFFVSPKFSSFPQWIEQLVAESTGKDGKGILPICDEEISPVDNYKNDRVFVFIILANDENTKLDKFAIDLIAAQKPVLIFQLDETYELAKEFYRWEIATALSSVVLKIHPFDQPDVQFAKTLAGESLKAYKVGGKLPEMKAAITEGAISLISENEQYIASGSISSALNEFLSQADEHDYAAIMAFTEYGDEVAKSLQSLRNKISEKYSLATTIGFGPRFLHSTGQLHKGGKNNGLFIQITNEIENDITVPGQGYSFGVLITAQAQGDFNALKNKNRRVISLHITGNFVEAINSISL